MSEHPLTSPNEQRPTLDFKEVWSTDDLKKYGKSLSAWLKTQPEAIHSDYIEFTKELVSLTKKEIALTPDTLKHLLTLLPESKLSKKAQKQQIVTNIGVGKAREIEEKIKYDSSIYAQALENETDAYEAGYAPASDEITNKNRRNKNQERPAIPLKDNEPEHTLVEPAINPDDALTIPASSVPESEVTTRKNIPTLPGVTRADSIGGRLETFDRSVRKRSLFNRAFAAKASQEDVLPVSSKEDDIQTHISTSPVTPTHSEEGSKESIEQNIENTLSNELRVPTYRAKILDDIQDLRDNVIAPLRRKTEMNHIEATKEFESYKNLQSLLTKLKNRLTKIDEGTATETENAEAQQYVRELPQLLTVFKEEFTNMVVAETEQAELESDDGSGTISSSTEVGLQNAEKFKERLVLRNEWKAQKAAYFKLHEDKNIVKDVRTFGISAFGRHRQKLLMDSARHTYMESLAQVLEGRKSEYRSWFAQRFVLDEQNERIASQKGLISDSKRELLARVQTSLKKYKWHWRIAGVAVAGIVIGTGAALAGAAVGGALAAGGAASVTRGARMAVGIGAALSAGGLTFGMLDERVGQKKEALINTTERIQRQSYEALMNNTNQLIVEYAKSYGAYTGAQTTRNIGTGVSAALAGGLVGASFDDIVDVLDRVMVHVDPNVGNYMEGIDDLKKVPDSEVHTTTFAGKDEKVVMNSPERLVNPPDISTSLGEYASTQSVTTHTPSSPGNTDVMSETLSDIEYDTLIQTPQADDTSVSLPKTEMSNVAATEMETLVIPAPVSEVAMQVEETTPMPNANEVVMKGSSVSQTLFDAFKAGSLKGLPEDLSQTDFINKMNAAIYDLNKNEAVMKLMKVESGNLDVIPAGARINIQPIIDRMNSRSIDVIETGLRSGAAAAVDVSDVTPVARPEDVSTSTDTILSSHAARTEAHPTNTSAAVTSLPNIELSETVSPVLREDFTTQLTNQLSVEVRSEFVSRTAGVTDPSELQRIAEAIQKRENFIERFHDIVAKGNGDGLEKIAHLKVSELKPVIEAGHEPLANLLKTSGVGTNTIYEALLNGMDKELNLFTNTSGGETFNAILEKAIVNGQIRFTGFDNNVVKFYK